MLNTMLKVLPPKIIKRGTSSQVTQNVSFSVTRHPPCIVSLRLVGFVFYKCFALKAILLLITDCFHLQDLNVDDNIYF